MRVYETYCDDDDDDDDDDWGKIPRKSGIILEPTP